MPSYAAAGLGQGLAQGAGQFAQALARVGQMRRQRQLDATERERYHDKIQRDRTAMRLQAVSTPGVSVGEPEGPMSSAVRKIGAVGETPLYFDPGAAAQGQMPWHEQGFSNRAGYLDWLRERGAAMRKPESERRKTPTYGQAKRSVDEMFQSGVTLDPATGQPTPEFSLPAPARAAKADSVMAGELSLSDIAGRFTAGGEYRPGGGDPSARQTSARGPTPDGVTWDPEAETYVDPMGLPVEPSSHPDLFRTEKRELFGVDRLAKDRTVAIPPDSLGAAPEVPARAGAGGGPPSRSGLPDREIEEARSLVGEMPYGEARDLLERAGYDDAEINTILSGG